MLAFTVCFIFWIISICGETFLFSAIHWFNPNLFFLVPVLFCLRWRGPENIYMFVVWGLTADCFSTLPYGLYGLTFLIFSFFVRWYAVKVNQSDIIALPIVTGVFTFFSNIMIYLIITLFFEEREISIIWIKDIFFYKVLATSLVAIPVYKLLLYFESFFKIHLSERKF